MCDMGFNYGISIAIALRGDIVSNIIHGPSMEYYNEYGKVSAELKATSNFLAEKIKERGF